MIHNTLFFMKGIFTRIIAVAAGKVACRPYWFYKNLKFFRYGYHFTAILQYQEAHGELSF